MLHLILSLRKKKHSKGPGPSTNMRRNERNNMGSTGTIPYLLLKSEDGEEVARKKTVCALWKYKQEQNPERKAKLCVTKLRIV